MSNPTKNPPTERGEKLTDIRRKYLERKKAELMSFKKDHFKNSNNRIKETWKVHYKHINEQLKGNKLSLKEAAKKVLGNTAKLTKAITPIGIFLTTMLPAKTATDKQMKEEMKKMKEKNNTDYRKGGMVLYTTDNRKKK